MAYRLIDHTADLDLEVTGTDAADLFVQAACALFDLITDRGALTGRATQQLVVTGADWSDLMVNWMRELLYLFNGCYTLVKDVSICRISETDLEARLTCEPLDSRRHVINQEIKAVTYHGIEVMGAPDRWTARIVLDV
jgi:SHS2 domain-containing protein